MRILREQGEPLTPYQRVKRWAFLIMTAIGAILAISTLASLFMGSLEVTLFLAGISLGFILVGIQQEIDVLASGAANRQRREQDGE